MAHRDNSRASAGCALAALLLAIFTGGCNTTGARPYRSQSPDLRRAEAQLQAGNPKAAVELSDAFLTQARNASPADRALAHVLVAEGRLAQGHYETSTEHFRAAAGTARSPAMRMRIARGLGDVRYRQRNFQGAMVQYELTLKHELARVDAAEVHYRLAVCYKALGRHREGVAHLSRAGRYEPSRKDPLRYESIDSLAARKRPARSSGTLDHRTDPVNPDRGSTGMSPGLVATRVPLLGRGRPHVISRSSWKAAPVRRNSARMGRIRAITVHHTAAVSKATSEGEAARQIRNIQRSHQRERKWADIAYHYVIDRGGSIWEGRPITVQGAHAGSPAANRGNIGIVLLGHFDKQRVSTAQRESLTQLMDWLRTTHGLTITDIYTHNEIRKKYKLSGTACPGQDLHGFLSDFRAARRGRPILARGRDRDTSYRVLRGDTLYSIARRFGVSPRALQRANRGLVPERLRPGATLQIPR